MDNNGAIHGLAEEPIRKWEPKKGFVNQSSTEIWHAICQCVHAVVRNPSEVKAISFGATCSLVVTDLCGNPCAVGPDFNDDSQDIMMWMDQRATEETQALRHISHPLMRFVGGSMSVEMEIPRLMWLKNHTSSFSRMRFFDLNEWLTWRSTNIYSRSFGSVTGKQGYLPIDLGNTSKGWCGDFFKTIGLGELSDDNYSRLGGTVENGGVFRSAGQPIGFLTPQAAAELGLHEGVVVSSGVVDAYAGWIGTVGSDISGLSRGISTRLATIAGTSTCHILVPDNPIFVAGAWGPYLDALIPGMWCVDSGQNATGKALDHLLEIHPAAAELTEVCMAKGGVNKYQLLNEYLETLRIRDQVPSIHYLTKDLFWYGDIYGNRTPYNDPDMCGSITGLSMVTSLEDLAIQYLALIESICFQMRQVITSINEASGNIKCIYLSGGQCKNPVITTTMATVLDLPLAIPHDFSTAVLRGTAILAANSCEKENGSLWGTMRKYCGDCSVVEALNDPSTKRLLNAKYEIFLDQAETQRRYRNEVKNALKLGNKCTEY